MCKFKTLLSLVKFLLQPDFAKRHWQNLPDATIQFWMSQPENPKMNEFLMHLLYQYPPTKSLLEIGCGSGHRLKAIHGRFPKLELKGVEVNSYAAARGNQELQNLLGIEENVVICSDLNDLTKDVQNRYSVVLSWAVLMYVHPIRIRRIVKTLLDTTDEMLIILEPTSSKILRGLFPSRNLSYCHDYLSILSKLQIEEIEVFNEDIPNSIWSPKYGQAKAIIARKRLE